VKRITGGISRGASHRKKMGKRRINSVRSEKNNHQRRRKVRTTSNPAYRQAFDEAYNEGYNEGLATGFEDGHRMAYEQPI
jgi:flagellar biosynthesis/type III secretory pathway protein FliH